MGLLGVALAGVVGLSLLSAAEASATTCEFPTRASDRESPERSRVAVLARVQKIRIDDPDDRQALSPESTSVLRVRRAYKRTKQFYAGRRIRVHGALGVPRGRLRGFFIYGRPGNLKPNLCSTTTRERLRRAAASRG